MNLGFSRTSACLVVTLACIAGIVALRAADETTSAKDNPYIPREGMSVEDLQAYVERMQEAPDSIRMRPGFGQGMAVAAERILEAKPSGGIRSSAVLTLLDGTRRWSQVAADSEQAEVDRRLQQVAENYSKDDDPQIATTAKYYAAERGLRNSDDVDPAELPALLDEMKVLIQARELGRDDLMMASSVVHAINRLSDDASAKKYLKQFGEIFSASKDPDLARYGAKAMERSDEDPTTEETTEWVGKPMELTGTTADGVAFDVSQYKGKVVLVDFWATWCGPCRAALPEVKAAYERFHADGFEVVGVSLDLDLSALADFLAEEKLPWVNIVGEEEDGKLSFPLAEKYGIHAIPATFLVGKDGVIVAQDLRGDELTQRIEKLLAGKEDK